MVIFIKTDLASCAASLVLQVVIQTGVLWGFLSNCLIAFFAIIVFIFIVLVVL